MEKCKLWCILRVYLHFVIVRENSLSGPQKPVGTFCYALLTLRPGMILVNNQIDAHLFVYIYFYSLHVPGSHVPIIRRIIVSMRHLVYATLCR